MKKNALVKIVNRIIGAIGIILIVFPILWLSMKSWWVILPVSGGIFLLYYLINSYYSWKRQKIPNAITVPNLVTAVRLLILLPFFAFMYVGDAFAAIVLFFIFFALDNIDGVLARKLNQGTDFGKNFDVFSDALFALAAYVVLLIQWSAPAHILITSVVVNFIYAIIIVVHVSKTGIFESQASKYISAITTYGLVFFFILGNYAVPFLVLMYVLLAIMVQQIWTYYWTMTRKKM